MLYNTIMNSNNLITDEFRKQLEPVYQIEVLFNCFPEICLYVKDAAGTFVGGNNSLAQICGVPSLCEVIGKNDFDFFPCDLATQYVEEDQRIMKTGEPLFNCPWIICLPNKKMQWFISSKIPLFGKTSPGGDRQVIGIAGIMKSYSQQDTQWEKYNDMKAPVDYMMEHYAEKINIGQLASMSYLSVSQFNRRFQESFRMPPGEFLTELRLKAASRLLVTTDLTLAAVSTDVGFFDQSHFSKSFKKKFGVAPGTFRKKTQE